MIKKIWGLVLVLGFLFGRGVVLAEMDDRTLTDYVRESEQRDVFLPQELVVEDKDAGMKQIRDMVRIGDGKCKCKVAIMDSGVEISGGRLYEKVVRYKDYTEEGKVLCQEVIRQGNGFYLNKVRYILEESLTHGEQYRYGKLTERGLEVEIALIQERKNWRIFADKNQDKHFMQEEEVFLYQKGERGLELGEYVFTAVSVAQDGEEIHFAYDGTGHGTFIATILTGRDEAYQGLLDCEEIFVYKIIDSQGKGTQSALARGIYDAVDNGAQLISLSMTLSLESTEETELKDAIDYAVQRGVVIVAAAGNYGSSLDTVAYPARDENVLAVGAMIDPILYETILQGYLPQRIIPAYSSCGGVNGEIDVVAPALASGIMPKWYGEKYVYAQGSSVACIVATAAIANMLGDERLDAKQRENLVQMIKSDAQDLGQAAALQGYGLIQVAPKTSGGLRKNNLPIKFVWKNGYLNVINDDGEKHKVEIQGLAEPVLMEVEPYSIGKIYLPQKKGIFSVALKGLIDGQESADVFLQIHATDGEELEKGEGLRKDFCLDSGVTERIILQVKEPCKIKISLALDWVIAEDKQSPIPLGRCAGEVYGPNGEKYFVDEIGVGCDKIEDSIVIEAKSAGTWQVNVCANAYLSYYMQSVCEGYVKISAEDWL